MNIAPPVIDTRTSLLFATQGELFEWTPSATGLPTQWEAVGLPEGLSINSGTGKVSGTPTKGGVYGFSVKATNYSTVVFTADAGTDALSAAAHPFEEGDRARVSSAGTLPAPLVADSDYFAKTVVAATSLKLAALNGGAAIDITDTGSGVHTLLKPQSDEMSVILAISPSTSRLPASDLTIQIDMDIVTRQVTVVGMGDYVPGLPLTTPPPTLLTSPVLTLKPGERFPVSIGFTRNGILQELDVKAIDILTREFFGDSKITLNEGGFTKVGSGESTRYSGTLSVSQTLINSILSNYDEEIGAQTDIAGEIVVEVFAASPDEINQSKSTTLSIRGGKDGEDAYTGTLEITGIPTFEGSVDCTVATTLAVADRASQSCLVTMSMLLSWNPATSTFAVSGVSGTATDAGAADGDNWTVSSFEIGTVVGTSTGINVPFTLETSEDANAPYAKFEILDHDGIFTPDETEIDLGSPTQIVLYAGDSLIGDVTLSGTYANAAALESAITSGWQTATSATDIQDVTVDLPGSGVVNITIELKTISTITKINFGAGTYPGPEYYLIPASLGGTPRVATITATAEQVSSWPVSTHRRNSDALSFRFLDTLK